MRARVIGLILGAALWASSAAAYDAYDPNNCNGVDWDNQAALVVAKITAEPRVNFIKSPYDDDFKAKGCPALSDACRKKSYLVTGDLVLVGKAKGDLTCVSFQSPRARKQVWTTGWLPNTALTAAPPIPSPKPADWIGSWTQPGGSITIKATRSGKMHVDGEMVVPGARDVHTGELQADVSPKGDTITFVDDGSTPFETKDEGECRVRMRRIGALLLVEDNSGCGGAGVSFAGLYRRK
jgi:hypothetical protein